MDSIKQVIILFIFLSCLFPTVAEVKVTDSETGLPLSKASVFDKNGSLIAITDENGIVPSDIKKSSYPLNIRYVGFNPVEVTTPEAGVISMTEFSYELPEVTIDTESINILYLTLYVRNYGTRVREQDTINIFNEKIIDLMFPMTKKAKIKGWKKGRVLAQRSYGRGWNATTDTTIYIEENDGSSYTYRIDDKFVVPKEILAGNSRHEEVPGKYCVKEIWDSKGDNYYLHKDMLADHKDHKYTPAITKMLGMTMTLTEEAYDFKFDKNGKAQLSPEDLEQVTTHWNLIIDGKLAKLAYETKKPIVRHGYGEMFVIDRAYLTAEEAKELKKEQPFIEASSFKAPDFIPLPPPEMQRIKDDMESRMNKTKK